jgi:hypothetical protein
MKFVTKILLFLVCFFIFNSHILASQSNIFGLHLTQPSDIDDASKIINSSGGDWGWATITIRMDQMDKNTWQEFFDKCRKHHIIPLMRIATIQDGDNWTAPKKEMIDQMSSFLTSLNWPTKTQHIILFNEPNHGQEWGGETNPRDFADMVIYASQKFKERNNNFFILPGALDLASPDKAPNFLSASTFYKSIYEYRPEFFDHIDGIASHSYPNHGYIGKPTDTGQHSIRGFDWELNFIKSLSVKKYFPVFITETSWPHREGETKNNKFYTTDTTSKFLIDAINIWQKYPNISAITPFIYNYPYEPFDNFSWLNTDKVLYPAYQKVIDMPKIANNPEQITSFKFESMDLPLIIFPDRQYQGYVIIKNDGQSIWGKNEKQICFNPKSSDDILIQKICTDDIFVYPGQLKKISFSFRIKPNASSIITQTSFLSWENLPKYEIISFSPSAHIYRPLKPNIQGKIIDFFEFMFKINIRKFFPSI